MIFFMVIRNSREGRPVENVNKTKKRDLNQADPRHLQGRRLLFHDACIDTSLIANGPVGPARVVVAKVPKDETPGLDYGKELPNGAQIVQGQVNILNAHHGTQSHVAGQLQDGEWYLDATPNVVVSVLDPRTKRTIQIPRRPKWYKHHHSDGCQ